jgi:hypothetical protein
VLVLQVERWPVICSTVSFVAKLHLPAHSSEKNPVHVDCVFSLSRVPGPFSLLRFTLHLLVHLSSFLPAAYHLSNL